MLKERSGQNEEGFGKGRVGWPEGITGTKDGLNHEVDIKKVFPKSCLG